MSVRVAVRVHRQILFGAGAQLSSCASPMRSLSGADRKP